MKAALRDTTAEGPSPKRRPPSLIVGIGASAGGLTAFKSFFSSMPADTGMTFVLVQHLAPDHKSMLVELLESHTAMRVTEARDRVAIAPNRVFIIPPNATLTFEDGVLRVSKPAPARQHRRPIDTLFSSLAENHEDCAVGIILSGVGSDGTSGVRTIKEHGGLTLAEAEFDSTAKSGMPRSAVSTGLVDHVLPVEEMAAKLIAYQQHLTGIEERKDTDGIRQDGRDHLATITTLLRSRVDHDFSGYKEKTLTRRIQRRMQVLQIATFAEYAEHLRGEPLEGQALFRELLIGVTQFFRDPEAFEALRTTAIPPLLAAKRNGDPVRVWVSGCATGEEVYSIAILLKEAMAHKKMAPGAIIFGTDIDANAIATARAGRYRKAIDEVSPERLERWFVKEGDAYCPIPAVREMCIFSLHSVVKDPPFLKLDLISCRNVLIYLDNDFQRRVMQTFHYALRPDGYLFLGTSESGSRDARLFAPVDKKHHILQRRDTGGRPTLPEFRPAGPPKTVEAVQPTQGEDRIAKSAGQALEKYSPAYFVIDRNYEILRFSGSGTGPYIEPSVGAASLNLFSILKKSLRAKVRVAVQQAFAAKQAVVNESLTVRIEGRSRPVILIVEPISQRDFQLCVVAFRERDHALGPESSSAAASGETHMLQQELQATKAQLQATVDELETYIEEMKSASEEYQSVNEELQSANEELETSKEEMQSVNEELQTINSELGGKNEQLMQANSDVQNLLDNTQIATIFLDDDLRIRNFTPALTELFPLRDSDRGRSITEIITHLSYDTLRADVTKVQRTLTIAEYEVTLKNDSATFIMRIRPYRTVKNVIDGVVITFVDVTERNRAAQNAQRLSVIVESSADAIISKNLNGVILSWNAGAERMLGFTADEAVGKAITILIPPERHDEETEIIERIRHGERIDNYDTVRRRKDGSLIDVSLSISPVRDSRGKVVGAAKIIQDITERKRRSDQLNMIMREMLHRTNNLLAVIQAMSRQTARHSVDFSEFATRFDARIQGLAHSNDLLVKQDWQGVTINDLVHAHLAPFIEANKTRVDAEGPRLLLKPEAAQSLGLALHELATNASKYGALSTNEGKITVRWERYTSSDGVECVRLTWREHGGPPVKTTQRKGFGRVVIEQMVARTLDAKVAASFAPEGVGWTFDVPAAHIVSEGPQSK